MAFKSVAFAMLAGMLLAGGLVSANPTVNFEAEYDDFAEVVKLDPYPWQKIEDMACDAVYIGHKLSKFDAEVLATEVPTSAQVELCMSLCKFTVGCGAVEFLIESEDEENPCKGFTVNEETIADDTEDFDSRRFVWFSCNGNSASPLDYIGDYNGETFQDLAIVDGVGGVEILYQNDETFNACLNKAESSIHAHEALGMTHVGGECLIHSVTPDMQLEAKEGARTTFFVRSFNPDDFVWNPDEITCAHTIASAVPSTVFDHDNWVAKAGLTKEECYDECSDYLFDTDERCTIASWASNGGPRHDQAVCYLIKWDESTVMLTGSDFEEWETKVYCRENRCDYCYKPYECGEELTSAAVSSAIEQVRQDDGSYNWSFEPFKGKSDCWESCEDDTHCAFATWTPSNPTDGFYGCFKVQWDGNEAIVSGEEYDDWVTRVNCNDATYVQACDWCSRPE